MLNGSQNIIAVYEISVVTEYCPYYTLSITAVYAIENQ